MTIPVAILDSIDETLRTIKGRTNIFHKTFCVSIHWTDDNGDYCIRHFYDITERTETILLILLKVYSIVPEKIIYS